jgi:divalent metal cation (Fe/Co/Zn/Cd) transporter
MDAATHEGHHHHADHSPEHRAEVLHAASRLEYFSLVWNVLETVVGMVAGLAAGSVALIGFALDSVVESSSASVLIWRIRSERRGHRTSDEAEKKAVRLVGAAFFALAIYVGAQATWDLVRKEEPDGSIVGIVLAAVSLVVMPVLAWRKRRAAVDMDSLAMQADASQTSLCTYISAFLLLGLGANAGLGWWWADPIAGLAIAALAANEGRELWTTEEFCAH